MEALALADIFGYAQNGIAMIFLLGVLIFIHELGHYLVARRNGVGVDVFALGFGYTLFSRKMGETEYKLCAFPLGGYVKLTGDDPDEVLSEKDKERSFSLATPATRLSIAFAGPFFNFILAFLVFTAVYMIGVPVPGTKIGKVMENSAAEVAGMQDGDVIIALNGKAITQWDELIAVVHVSPNIPIDIEVERTTEKNEEIERTVVVQLTVTPKESVVKNIFGEDESVGLIGVQLDQTSFKTERYNPFKAILLGAEKTYYITHMTLIGIGKLIEGIIPKESIGGPIMILQMAGQQADAGLMQYAVFIAFISINLAIINLFPIPVLDGGHILFSLIEILTGKPVGDKTREYSTRVGIALLGTLMIFAFYNDIMRLVQ